MMDARALSVVLTGLSAGTQVLAAPANEQRGFTIPSGRHGKISKKTKIILIASGWTRSLTASGTFANTPAFRLPAPRMEYLALCPFIGIMFLWLILYIIWLKMDIREKIRDRYMDWRMKRDLKKALDKFSKDLEAMSDPPSTDTAAAQPNSSAQSDKDKDNLAAPSSPNSKAPTDALTPSENQQQQLPPYTETPDIKMPEPAYIRSQPDPNAPVPYTKELAP